MEIMTQPSSTSDLEKMHALAVRLNPGERAHGVLWTEHAILDVMKKTAKQHYTEATETCLMVGSDDGV
jgi:hypothetical protein